MTFNIEQPRFLIWTWGRETFENEAVIHITLGILNVLISAQGDMERKRFKLNFLINERVINDIFHIWPSKASSMFYINCLAFRLSICVSVYLTTTASRPYQLSCNLNSTYLVKRLNKVCVGTFLFPPTRFKMVAVFSQ